MPVVGPLIVVVVVVVVVIVVAAIVALSVSRGRSDSAADPVVLAQPPRIRPADEPMTGLESALAQVTDRAGRPIGDRIDAESGHIDELRVPDDTGPLLRRALDHVAHEPDQAGPATDVPDGVVATPPRFDDVPDDPNDRTGTA